MTIVRLSYEQVLKLHDDLLNAFGGQAGVRDHDRVKSALESPFQVLFGQEAYPGVALKGAVMCFELAEGQGFVDGNKRTAFHSAVTFFELNGGEVRDESFDFEAMDAYMRSLSTRSYEDVEQWFRAFVDNI